MADRDFPRLLAAEGISTFGTMLSRPATTQLAMLTLQATPLQLAALLMADVAAVALGSLLLGSLVDRSGKRAASVRQACGHAAVRRLACNVAGCAGLWRLARRAELHTDAGRRGRRRIADLGL